MVTLLDELRIKLQAVIDTHYKPLGLVADELEMSRITLNDFLKGKVNPRYETICKIREYIDKNSDK